MKAEKKVMSFGDEASRVRTDVLLGFLDGPDGLGTLMRTFDWSKTALGPIERWPQSLRTSVSICLNSPLAMILWWGPELTVVYNTPFVPVLGEKHPEMALGKPGKECWADKWDAIGTILGQVLNQGVANAAEDLQFLIHRSGYLEECYFTFSHSPIRDESGGVGGVLTVVADTTEKVIGERRLRTLHELGGGMNQAITEAEVFSTASQILARNPYDIPFVSLFVPTENGTMAELRGCAGTEPGQPLAPESIALNEQGHAFLASLLQSSDTTVSEIPPEIAGSAPRGPWGDGTQSIVTMPLAAGRVRPAGYMVCGVSARKRLDRDYLSFIELAAVQVANGMAGAHAVENEHKRAESLQELDRVRTAFLSNVSHEFRTPLALLFGRLEEAIRTNQLARVEGEAEQAIRESAARLQLAMESAALGAWEYDHASGLAIASERVRELLGVTADETPRECWFSRLHPDDRARVESEFTAAFDAGQAYDSEYRVVHDGCIRWVRAKGHVLNNGAGPRRMVGVAEDITDRKLAELALRESELRIRAIVNTALDGVIAIDENGAITEWNGQAESIFGWSRVEALGMPLTNIIPAQHREAHRRGMELYLRTGKGPILNRRVEITALRRTGEEFPVELAIAPTTAGGKQFFSAFIRDITRRKQAEKALLESESRFRQLAENIREVFYITDMSNSAVLYISPGYEEIWGRSCESLYDDPLSFLESIHGDDRPLVRAAMERQARGESSEVEYRLVRPDGTIRWIWDRGYPVFRDGRLHRTVGIAEDITQRRLAEEELRSAEGRLTIALKSAPLILYTTDCDLRYTWVHRPHGGDQPGEVLGKTDDELFSAGDARELIDLKLEVLRTGIGERKEVSLQVRGEHEVHDVTIEPLLDRQNSSVGVIVAALDVTARARAAEEIRRSERAFRELADSMPQMVWTARPDGYVDYYNERWYEFTGFPRGEGGDRSWEPILHPDDVQRCYETWYGAVKSGEVYEIEYRFWDRASSGYRWFLGRALPVRDDSGRICRWFGTCTDIDQQKGLQADLQRANSDLEQFAYSASHDLQEPLRNVAIYSDLIARQYSSALDSEGLEYLAYMREGASRMELLIRDLLEYTRVVSTGEDSPTEWADADKVLEMALSNLTETIKECDARLVLQTLPHVRMHPVHLQQLFQNLIGNALKYRGTEQPRIEVFAQRREGRWVFGVRDNGIGIDPEYSDRIFGIFKRLHAGDKYAGTGIGLAICQRIVERYRGRIWVDSEPGKGSTFFFTVPG